MSRFSYILTLLAVLIFSGAYAQEELQMLGKEGEKEILLRWAPPSPASWELLNKYGYSLVRYTVSRDGKILSTPEEFIINNNLHPDSVALGKNIDTDDEAAVAAQAIYGDGFQLSENFSNDIMQVVNKATELEQRYSFALFVADQSFNVAKMSGLAYTDNQIKANEKYLYRIQSNVPDSIMQIGYGKVYLTSREVPPLPKPTGIKETSNGSSVMIRWDKALFDKVYNSYYIERSENGGAFGQIFDLPYLNTESSAGQSEYFYFSDSINVDNKYAYRLRGKTPFSELGPYSDTVIVEANISFDYPVNITSHSISKAGAVDLNWVFPDSLEVFIEQFQVERATAASGDYTIIKKDLSVNRRSYTDTTPLSTAYYRVAYLSNNKLKHSFPYLVQLQDSIPPAPPKNLTAVIDTIGNVTLKWDENTEADLLGYKVYRSNFKNSEFGEVTTATIGHNTFIDSIRLDNLSKKIYYKVEALDNRFNRSEYSDWVEVTKPDILPPTKPVFTDYKVKGDSVYLTWQRSWSKDVKQYVLYRKEGNINNWLQLNSVDSKASNYVDVLKSTNQEYEYTLVAVDSSNNESEPAAIIRIASESKSYPPVSNLKYKIDNVSKTITLTWKYEPNDDIEGFRIYRKVGDGKMGLLTTVGGQNKEFTEDLIQQGLTYGIMTLYSNGAHSEILILKAN
ncbi:fibronectin type III domain-containing protein [Fulvivirga ligni]|uniref:fibronectin type III domain-containing protein n=1 Tax=Fulvivirga ligni TaxID=2904246 RepID=UPI001F42CD33|nr:hypothetical protein [Fulvivirga ligni]UII20011.1 hypothetical protein LVD16_19385 [Fulvivirga ligni]